MPSAVLSRVQDAYEQVRTALLLRRKGGRLSTFLNVNVSVRRHQQRVVIPLIGGVGFDNLVISEGWMASPDDACVVRARSWT
jgi:hypothetical protein